MKILDDWRKVRQLDRDIAAIEKDIDSIDNSLRQEDGFGLQIYLSHLGRWCEGYSTKDRDVVTAALKAAKQTLSVKLYNLRKEADTLIQK